MKEILQTWLENVLGIFNSLDRIIEVLKDGMIFIRILKHYNAVNIKSIKNVFPTDDDRICKNNLTQLKVWFRLLDIEFSDEIINEIITGNSQLSINILYKLYLALEYNSILPFVTKQKERCFTKQNDRFTVSKLSLANIDEKECFKDKYNYADKINGNKALIDWYESKCVKKRKWTCRKSDKSNNVLSFDGSVGSTRNVSISSTHHSYIMKKPSFKKSQELKQMCSRQKDISYVREELNNYSKLDNKSSSEDFSDCYRKVTGKFMDSDPSDSYFQTCKQDSFLPPISPQLVNEYRLPQNVKEYMRKLKSSVGFQCKRYCRPSSTYAINKVWDVLLDSEKSDLKTTITYRLFKQSSYEKELAAKFVSIRNQHRAQKMFYIDLEKQILRSRKSVVSLDISHNNNFVDECRSYDKDVNDKYGNEDEDDANKLDSSYFNSFNHRYKYDSFQVYSQSEKNRTVELHRRLYAEKLKLQFERHYNVCLHALEDMIELAVRKSEFRSKYKAEVPKYMWSDWKCLLYHNQPIYDFIKDIKVLLYPDLNNMNITAELFRQDLLNENNLNMYIEVADDWEVYTPIKHEDAEESDSGTQQTFDHNTQIPLGYCIHRVLEKKYPLTPKPKPANIVKLPIVAVVNGIYDVEAIQNLKTILQKADILVVDVNTAVNFCLQSFKDRFSLDNIGTFNDENGQVPSLTTIQSNDTIDKLLNNELKEEFTQTGSSLFVINDDSLDAAVLIGCDIFNMMLFGNELPFNILVNSIVQFIKHKEHELKGWVLLNIPSTMYQASVLEHILTGKKFPYSMDDDLHTSSESECNIDQTAKETIVDTINDIEVKSSRIVQNPNINNSEDIFKTYFTMNVTMIKGSYVSSATNDDDTSAWDDIRSENTLLLEQPEKEGIPTLREFYRDQGIGYDFIYEKFDLNALKQLAQVILVNYIEEAKILKQDQLFSEELLKEFEPSIILKWQLPSGNYLNESTLFQSKNNQFLSDEMEKSKSFIEIGSLEAEKFEDVKWNFADYPIPDNILRTLASFWEAIENVYLNNLKEVFFTKRVNDYTIMPYILQLTHQFNCHFDKEDERQNIVTQFLDAYNSISRYLRSNSDLKNELHLRTIEMQEELTYLCQKKCEEMQNIVLAFINHNWTYQVMALYTNCFITLIQIELDRFVKTFEFLQDYYRAMLGLYDSEPIANIAISKIDIHVGEEVVDEISDYEIDELDGGEEEEEEEEVEEKGHKFWHYIKRVSINQNIDEINDDLYKSIIERIKNYAQFKDSTTPFYEEFCNKTDTCFEAVLKIKSKLDNVISKEESVAFKKLKDQFRVTTPSVKSQNKSQKKTKRDETAVQSPSNIQDQKLDSNENDNYETKETLLKSMFEEWKFAVNGELVRLSFRIELIKRKLQLECYIIEDLIGNKFARFYDLINERFSTEIYCIGKLCKLFQVAIEEKTPINAKLIFKHDEFYVIKSPIEKLEHPVKLPTPLEELMQEESFTIKQLAVIKERLKIIAPNGIITREAFVSFIANIISSSHDNLKLVPALWNTLKHNDLELVFQKIFGKYSLIEWRNFLIYCLELPFPVTEDIIDAKLQFSRYDYEERELLTYDDYMKTTLWFQRELPENPLIALRNILAKEYLFELFKTSSNLLNYTSFLLTFCRDMDPKVGFGKILSLLMGRCVIVYHEDLYLEEIMTDHIQTEIKVVNGILVDIINDVVDNSLSGKRDDFVDRSILNKEKSTLLKHNENNDASVLSQTMYYQFFRRFSTLKWISKVPRSLISTVLSVIYYPMYKPEYFLLYPDICDEIYKHMMSPSDEDIFVPQFVNNWWIEEMVNLVRQFTAFSLRDIVKENINNRSP